MRRFSIRDLLWLLTLAAVLTAWGVDHWRQAAQIHELQTTPWPPKRWQGFTLDAF